MTPTDKGTTINKGNCRPPFHSLVVVVALKNGCEYENDFSSIGQKQMMVGPFVYDKTGSTTKQVNRMLLNLSHSRLMQVCVGSDLVCDQ